MREHHKEAAKPATRKVSARDALQQIGEVLVQAGYDNIITPTNRGAFHWITPQRARELGDKKWEQAVELAPDEHFQHIEDALLKAGFR